MQKPVLFLPGGPQRTPVAELDGSSKHDGSLDPQLKQTIPGEGGDGSEAELSPRGDAGGQYALGDGGVAAVAILDHVYGDGESGPLSKLLPARSQPVVEDGLPSVSNLGISWR